ncbi:MAG: hypothetical protein ACWA6Y_03300 [Polaromonas sp.]
MNDSKSIGVACASAGIDPAPAFAPQTAASLTGRFLGASQKLDLPGVATFGFLSFLDWGALTAVIPRRSLRQLASQQGSNDEHARPQGPANDVFHFYPLLLKTYTG